MGNRGFPKIETLQNRRHVLLSVRGLPVYGNSENKDVRGAYQEYIGGRKVYTGEIKSSGMSGSEFP